MHMEGGTIQRADQECESEGTARTVGAGVLCYAVAPHTGELFFLLGKESGGAADARLRCEPPPPPRASSPPSSSSPPRCIDSPERCARDPGHHSGRSDALPRRRHIPGCAETPVPQSASHVGSDCVAAECHADAAREEGRTVGVCIPDADRPGVTVADRMQPVRAGCPPPTPPHRWSDFAGRIEPGESEEEAAAREFFEETLGLVCTDSCRRSGHSETACDSVDVGARAGPHGDADRRALARDLAAGHYEFKVRTCVNYGAGDGMPKRYHVTFVKRVPWMPSVVLQFARLRARLAALARRSAVAGGKEPNDADEGSHDESDGARGCDGDGDDDGAASAGGPDGGDGAGDREICAMLGSDGMVRAECLEKDCIQFWSVRRLQQALDNGGCFRREHLRPLFVPTIAVVLEHMAPGPALQVGSVVGASAPLHWRSAVRVDRADPSLSSVPPPDTPPRTPTPHRGNEAGRADCGAVVYTVQCRTPRQAWHRDDARSARALVTVTAPAEHPP